MSNGKSKILLAHGSGGKLMHRLIKELFQKKFSNEILNELSDSAVIRSLPQRAFDLCFTTDTYVVNPIFFPGGDIGKLAICGTINDLAVEGAEPLYLSCGFIIEEGLEYGVLEAITESMAKVAQEEGVKIVTGDLKVVEKGKADKVFINTSGVGIKDKKINLAVGSIKPGDKILINGSIGEHGVAVLAARGKFELETDLKSDCAPLTVLIHEIMKVSRGVKFMRDPTRGGLATTLNEIVSGAEFGILINETSVPVKEEVKAACEILGFDPLYIANEGKVVVVAEAPDAEKILDAMRHHPLGKGSCIIGEVIKEHPGKVIMKTGIGGHRIIEMLSGEQLPRIC